jgi:periplasmic divalent cation tolerance protein
MITFCFARAQRGPARQFGCDATAFFRQYFRMAKPEFTIVLVTAPDLKTARHLAQAALTARLIACANLVPKIESHYRWQGKLERSAEVLLIMKTTNPRLAALEKLILAEHPYDTPEFVVLNLAGGTKKYLAWLRESCG